MACQFRDQLQKQMRRGVCVFACSASLFGEESRIAQRWHLFTRGLKILAESEAVELCLFAAFVVDVASLMTYWWILGPANGTATAVIAYDQITISVELVDILFEK